MEDNNDLKKFIKDRLDLLDYSNYKYNDLITTKDIKFDEVNGSDYISFLENGKVKYKGKANLLGLFDSNSKVWIWPWALPSFSMEETKDSREILNYGLTLEPSTNSRIHYYIKPHLVNSRLRFDNDIFIDIQLSLSLYINKKALFVYPRIREKINGKNIIVYYLVY